MHVGSTCAPHVRRRLLNLLLNGFNNRTSGAHYAIAHIECTAPDTKLSFRLGAVVFKHFVYHVSMLMFFLYIINF